MTDAAVGAGALGRRGIVSLAGEALRRPPQEERPVTVLLGPRGSGASETHSALMELYGPTYPFAYLRFAPGRHCCRGTRWVCSRASWSGGCRSTAGCRSRC